MDTLVNTRYLRHGMIMVMTFSAFSAWADDHSSETTMVADPYERYNRVMFRFNETADHYVMEPVAHTYQKVTPRPVRSAVGNFFNNLRDVVSFGSNLLRGNVKNAGYDFMRVAVNTTFGFGGLINIADEAGMPNNKNTLGDTFASWGWKNSHYLIMPFTGPSTVRDSLGNTIVDIYSVEKAILADQKAARYSSSVLRGLDKRTAMLPLTDSLKEVHGDKYVYTRNLFMNIRNHQVGNKIPEDNENIDDLVTPEDNTLENNTEPSDTPSLTPDEINTPEIQENSLINEPIFVSSEAANIHLADDSLSTLEELDNTLIQVWAKSDTDTHQINLFK